MPDVILKNLPFLLHGLWLTVELSAWSIVLGTLLGLLVGTIRFVRVPVLNVLAAIYVEFIRGTPLLVVLFITYFALPALFGYRTTAYRAAIFGFVGAFDEVAVSLILGGTGYQLLGNAIASALDVLNYPLAAAISTVATGLMPAPLRLTRMPELVGVISAPVPEITSSAVCRSSGRAPSRTTSPPVIATAMA